MNQTSTMHDLITQTASRLFADHITQSVLEEAGQGIWPSKLWQAVQETGLHLVSIPEEIGGIGGEWSEATLLLHTAARYAVPLPLAEYYLAGWILGTINAGLLGEDPITIALPHTNQPLQFTLGGDANWRVAGTVFHVPYARHASHALLFGVGPEGPTKALVSLSAARVTQIDNVAGEPRDTLFFDNTPLTEPFSSGVSLDECWLRGALFRTIQMVGAMEAILEKSIRYVGEREQFGRPIAKFQAIQQSMAQLAGEVAASQAAMHGAILAYQELAEDESWLDSSAEQIVKAKAPVAMAKIRVGEAAGTTSRIAHQVHGAMGFTQEYSLHFYTRRLWAWREEFGNESEWADWLGQHVANQGAERLWPFVTSI